MNFPVIEIFHSIQGEGEQMGNPSFFVRLSGCNLRCVFKNSICDTPYSSFNPEKSPYKTIEDVVAGVINLKKQFPNTIRLVITGGEPMLYQDGIIEFIKLLDRETERLKDIHILCKTYEITIETNGTIKPTKIIDAELNGEYISIISLFSISPKLSSSIDKEYKYINKETADRHNKTRINIDALSEYIYSNVIPFQMKFVYSGEECIDEIKDIYDKLKQKYKYNTDHLDYVFNDHTYLMPEGTTVDQMNEKSKECVEQCIKQGWKFAPRLHILIWGDKRGV